MPAVDSEGQSLPEAQDAHPAAGRPKMPDGYGVPDSDKGLLPWSFVEERLSGALNYWVATVRPDGRPHAMPVWGVWLNGCVYIEGSPETRRGRNIASNPAVVVHLESGDQVVILEGEAHEIRHPERALTEQLSQLFSAKYAAAGYSPGPDNWDRGGLYRVQPHTVFAWTSFPSDTTRWKLKQTDR